MGVNQHCKMWLSVSLNRNQTAAQFPYLASAAKVPLQGGQLSGPLSMIDDRTYKVQSL